MRFTVGCGKADRATFNCFTNQRGHFGADRHLDDQRSGAGQFLARLSSAHYYLLNLRKSPNDRDHFTNRSLRLCGLYL